MFYIFRQNSIYNSNKYDFRRKHTERIKKRSPEQHTETTDWHFEYKWIHLKQRCKMARTITVRIDDRTYDIFKLAAAGQIKNNLKLSGICNTQLHYEWDDCRWYRNEWNTQVWERYKKRFIRYFSRKVSNNWLSIE